MDAPAKKVVAFRPVVIWPDPRLSHSASPVLDEVVESLSLPSPLCEALALRKLLDEMANTMLYLGAAGLAAPQVGELVRAFVLKVQKTDDAHRVIDEQVVHLINPVVTFESAEKQTTDEGCLSFPGLHFPRERPNAVRVRAFGYDGQPFEVGGDGLLAVALMHELDHLNGITLADSLGPCKRDLIRRRLIKAKRRGLRYRTPVEIMESVQ